MDFENLKALILKIKEIKLIGRTRCVDGALCHVIGLTLQADGVLQLLILEYDEDYSKKAEQAELDAMNGVHDAPVTNRTQQSGVRNLLPSWRFHNTQRVCFGELEFTSNEKSSEVCSIIQWDNAALFTRFLLCGWNPAGLETQNTEHMFLSRLTLEGEFNEIPDIDISAPIRFVMGHAHTKHLVEKPITLTVGEDYNDKIYFADKETGRQNWIQINRVYLYDIWDELEKSFDNPRLKEHLSDEELIQRKAEVEANFIDKCPKGKRFLAVDYECEDNASVQFYSKRWLEDTPKHENSSFAVGIMASPEQPTGKLGLKLKTALIAEPFSADTMKVEAELFIYHLLTMKDDVVRMDNEKLDGLSMNSKPHCGIHSAGGRVFLEGIITMPKLRKMLGAADSPYIVSLMRLIETQSKATIAKWCMDYAETHILPVFKKHCPEDNRPRNAINAARDWFDGKRKLPEVKHIILNECHAAARELNDNPAAQAAARCCGQAAACFHTPTHSLGLAFYGAAAIAYDRYGLNESAEFYDGIAAGECAKMEAALRDIAVENEPNPAKIKWNC